MAEPPDPLPWGRQTAVEFDVGGADPATMDLPRDDTCRCCVSTGDVAVRLPPGDDFSFSFTVQGHNQDFLLFSGPPDAGQPFLANFVCWHPNCTMLPRPPAYTATVRGGALLFAGPGHTPKEDVRARPLSRRLRVPLPKGASAVSRMPEGLVAPVKRPSLSLTGNVLTFRLWAGAVLILNPCQLPEDDAVRRQWVRLNVRGTLFDTVRPVLLRDRDTFFGALLDWEPNGKGQYEIDRSPTHFHLVLAFLHSGRLDIWSMSREEIRELQDELDYYAISSSHRAADCHFEVGPHDVAAIRLSLCRTVARCVLCTADLRLVLPPGCETGRLLLSFTLRGRNTDFMLYSGDDFSRDPFFANFYVSHHHALPIPPLERYVIKIADGRVSFVNIGNPPADKPVRYAIQVTTPISDASLPLKGNALYFRLWAGVEIALHTPDGEASL